MDNKLSSCPRPRENVCIDTKRVLDACRDKDYFENIQVYLTDFGQDIIERTSSIRSKNIDTIGCFIDVTEVPFNRGFYQLNIRFYILVTCEACMQQGVTQEFSGISVVEKKVVLFGSEGNVTVFQSAPGVSTFCNEFPYNSNRSNTLPTAVVETIEPIVLDLKVVDGGGFVPYTCCMPEDIPESVGKRLNGVLKAFGGKQLVISLGMFSVVRIERPCQIIVSATEYNIPEKECIAPLESNPSSLFQTMAFPSEQFSSPSVGNLPPRSLFDNPPPCSCNGN